MWLLLLLLPHGICEAVMQLCLEKHQLIFCVEIFEEIREKLAVKIKVPNHIIKDYLELLRVNSLMLKSLKVEKDICKDPDDLKIFGLAESANADIIITGDKDILVKKKYKKTLILSPRDFWELNRKIRMD